MDMKMTERESNSHLSLLEQLKRIVDTYGDQVAVEENKTKTSYRELDALSDKIAANLIKQGVGTGSNVAVCLPRSLHLSATLVAIIKCGACYVPIDPEAPNARQAMVIQQSNATHGIGTIKRNAELCILSLAELLSFNDSDIPTCPVNVNTRMCLFFTSGSTGIPKGVAITQHGILNLVIKPDYVSIFPGARMAHWANPTFDAQLFEIWGAFLNGATLVVFDQAQVIETQQFADKIRQSELDFAFITATLFNFMVETYPSDIVSIRHLLVGGEALSPIASQLFFNAQKTRPNNAKSQLYNAYGPTECTTFSLCHALDESRLDEYLQIGRIPIGVCIGSTQALVINQRAEIALQGEVGELYLSGPSLAEGYFNDDEKTDQVFTRLPTQMESVLDSRDLHPNGQFEEVIWYKTGDLASHNSRNEMDYFGRIDDQVKIRGHRVEIAEIDQCLLSYPLITQASTIAVPQLSGIKDLYSYIVLSEAIDRQTVTRFLRMQLPSYMIPHRIFSLAKLPLTANGKLDKNLLLKSDMNELLQETKTDNDSHINIAYLAPIKGIRLREILETILVNTSLSFVHSFIENGGDSLKAMAFASQVMTEFSVSISVGEILQATPLNEIITRIEHSITSKKQPSVTQNINEYPASKEQARLYFLHLLEPESTAYFAPFYFHLESPIIIKHLQNAWRNVVKRHNALKSQFNFKEGELHVFISHKMRVEIEHENVKQENLERYIDRFIKTPFDLANGPLAKLCLVSVEGQNKQILMMTFHHLIIDGWSINILLNELSQFYNTLIKGDELILTPTTSHYADFCLQSHKAPLTDVYQNNQAFWHAKRAEFKKRTPLFSNSNNGSHGDQIMSIVDSNVWNSIKQCVSEEGITLFSYVLAAYSLALKEEFKHALIPIGSPIANRLTTENDPLVGLFANTTVFYCKDEGFLPTNRFLQSVHLSVADTLQYQALDYQEISALKATNQPSEPLFECLLVLENTDLNKLHFTNTHITAETGFAGDAKFPISLYLTPTKGEANLCLEFQDKYLDHNQAKQLLDQIKIKLLALAEKSHLPVNALNSVVTFNQNKNSNKSKALQAISDASATCFDELKRWNNDTRDFDSEISFIDLFEQQVLNNPDATACIWHQGNELRTLTYGELNVRANQLSHHLIQLNIGHGDIVGLASAWSIYTCIGILAIAKTGAAYLPLDPRNPIERSMSMLNLASITTVIGEHKVLDGFNDDITALALDSSFVRHTLSAQITTNPKRKYIAQSELNLAFVIYTSGSTGEPKGVMVTHSNITNLLLSLKKLLVINHDETFLSITAPSFDIHVTELYLPLICGSKIAFLDWEDIHTPTKLAQRQQDYAVSVMQATPATWQLLIDTGWKPSKHLKMLTGGDHLSLTLKNALLATHARLFNLYGPSETAVYCSAAEMTKAENSIHVGFPITNNRLYILDEFKKAVPIGVSGELYIAGANVGAGYLNNDELTQSKFTLDPFVDDTCLHNRMYQSGDLAKRRTDGAIVLLGRTDFQIKLNGFRIETGDIEACLTRHKDVSQALVSSIKSKQGGDLLIAYVQSKNTEDALRTELMALINARLPSYMQPSFIVPLTQFPLTQNGKIDRKRLPVLSWKSIPNTETVGTVDKKVVDTKQNDTDLKCLIDEITRIVHCVLGYDIESDKHFFEAGLNSILLMKVHSRLIQSSLINKPKLSLMSLFDAPSIEALAQLIVQKSIDDNGINVSKIDKNQVETYTSDYQDIAVVGMAVNLPKAENLNAFWQVISQGINTIEPISTVINESDNWINRVSSIKNITYFDASYFGISENDARLMDPQQRHALMTAVQALDDANIKPDENNQVGVVLSAGESHYQENILSNLTTTDKLDKFHLSLLNEKDFLATRVAYHLNLKGPAMSVQTACSSSLVAIHQACQQLRNGESQVCLAGGVNLDLKLLEGYPYREGMILSKTGFCRPFSKHADGTVPANGIGMVVLKRLTHAVSDGDRIYATIKGSAINNDGNDKVSFFAPSISGQVDVINKALKNANIKPNQIGYIEAHGTGTPLGDPIEVEALSQVFEQTKNAQENTLHNRYLGSLKSQMGHLGAAAGVAGFIRNALSLYHQKIPPTLWVNDANEKIDFSKAGLDLTPSTLDWPASNQYAAISSFGIGGSNAHLIMTEGPVSHTKKTLSLPKPCFNLKPYLSHLYDKRKTDIIDGTKHVSTNQIDDIKALPENQWMMQESWTRGKRLVSVSKIQQKCVIIDNKQSEGECLLKELKRLNTEVSYFNSLSEFISSNGVKSTTAKPLMLINFNDFTQNMAHNEEEVESKERYKSWLELVTFFQYWSQNNVNQPLHFINLVRGSAEVLGDETLLPNAGLSLGFTQTIPLEFENIAYSVLDIPYDKVDKYSDGKPLTHALNLLNEDDEHVSLRGHYLWYKSYERISSPCLSERDVSRDVNLLECSNTESVYVITGGAGGIGDLLKDHLLNKKNTRVICLNRSSGNDTLDPNLILNSIKCDVTNLTAMAFITKLIKDSFGHITGVIHAAGMPGSGMLRLLDKNKAIDAMSAKVEGALNIEKTLLTLNPEVIIYSSSMSIVYGVAGQSDYCAANHFLDLMAKKQNNKHQNTQFISINWPTWNKVGMAKDVTTSEFSMRKEQGITLFETLLKACDSQYLISPLSHKDASLFFASYNQKSVKPLIKQADKVEIENFVETLFVTILGVDSVKNDVCFYDLGGDSLSVLDLYDSIQKAFPNKVLLAQLNDNVTIKRIVNLLKLSHDTHINNDLGDDLTYTLKEGEGDLNIVIHPIGGELGGYRALVNAMPQGETVLGIKDSIHTNLTIDPIKTVEEMARYYLNAIEFHKPKRIIGWSFGALIAWEITRLLELKGEYIDLILIDPPSSLMKSNDVVEHNQGLFISELIQQYPELKGRVTSSITAQELVSFIIPPDKYQNIEANNEIVNLFEKVMATCEKNEQAMTLFKATTALKSKTKIFIARQHEPHHISETIDIWSRILMNKDFYDIEGDHYSMLSGDGLMNMIDIIRSR